MKKLVLKLDLHEDKKKQKVMKTVSRFSGIVSITIDMKEKSSTVIGDIDPVKIVAKLRKICPTEILIVGPAQDPQKDKKEEPQKGERKKEEYKRNEFQKEEPKRQEPRKDSSNNNSNQNAKQQQPQPQAKNHAQTHAQYPPIHVQYYNHPGYYAPPQMLSYYQPQGVPQVQGKIYVQNQAQHLPVHRQYYHNQTHYAPPSHMQSYEYHQPQAYCYTPPPPVISYYNWPF